MPRLIDADKLKEELSYKSPATEFDIDSVILRVIDEQPTVNPWHRVEEPPEENGAYAVCWKGSNSWGKLFYYGVWLSTPGTPFPDYWMPIEPPEEDA